MATFAWSFVSRPRVAEAVPPYLALKLGGTVWVGAPELPKFSLTGAEPATRCYTMDGRQSVEG